MASQVSKLNYVDRKLGAPTSGQQTTRILYDTIQVNTGDPTQDLKFFENFAGKGIAQTNLTTNKLDSSESVVIKQIQFIQTYNQSQDAAPNAAQTYIMNVFVGNQRVIKNFPLYFGRVGGTTYGLYKLSSQAQGNFGPPAWDGLGHVVFRALTDIVIPPQTNFRVIISKGGTNGWAPTGDDADVKYFLNLKGYGQIFSAGSSF